MPIAASKRYFKREIRISNIKYLEINRNYIIVYKIYHAIVPVLRVKFIVLCAFRYALLKLLQISKLKFNFRN